MEEWFDAKYFEEYLQVTKRGKVRSKSRWLNYIRNGEGMTVFYKGKVLINQIDKDGYYTVNFRINKKFHNARVHRLVAQTFIDNPDNKPCVNHIDHIRNNNDYTNLEWCTASENNKHTKDSGRTHCPKIPNELVNYIKYLYASGCYTQRDLAKKYDTTCSNIWYTLNKR